MRTVTAPALSASAAPSDGVAGGPCLADAVSIDIGAESATALDPDLRVFAADLVRPYGFPLAEPLP